MSKFFNFFDTFLGYVDGIDMWQYEPFLPPTVPSRKVIREKLPTYYA